MSIKVFFCYAREDEVLLNMLKAHLRPLQYQGLIDIWYDRDVHAGGEWEKEIREHLDIAQIILLLVSPHFINSDYCYRKEMVWALERHEKGETHVIPVILKWVLWQIEPLHKLQVLPTDGKPVVSAGWHSQDEALFNVVEGIRKVAEELIVHDTIVAPAETEKAPQPITKPNGIIPTVQIKQNISRYVSPLLAKIVTLLHTLPGHTSPVTSVAISPDGQTIVSGSADNTIRVWRMKVES